MFKINKYTMNYNNTMYFSGQPEYTKTLLKIIDTPLDPRVSYRMPPLQGTDN